MASVVLLSTSAAALLLVGSFSKMAPETVAAAAVISACRVCGVKLSTGGEGGDHMMLVNMNSLGGRMAGVCGVKGSRGGGRGGPQDGCGVVRLWDHEVLS